MNKKTQKKKLKAVWVSPLLHQTLIELGKKGETFEQIIWRSIHGAEPEGTPEPEAKPDEPQQEEDTPEVE